MRTKIFTTILMGACLALVAFAIPTSVNAQIGQLRYQNRYSKAQIGQIISKLESSSNIFKSAFDKELDRSPLNGTNTEDQYNRYVSQYEDSLDRLRKEFNRNRSWWLIRNEVSDVVAKASPVNDIINGLSFRRNIERQWNNMRNDLNKLADTFDLPGLNGGGWNGGPWTGGGNWGGGVGRTSTPPSWAQGTWYWMNGPDRRFTIDRNGRITLYTAGQTSYGTYYNGIMTLDGNTSTITRRGNNIRTYNQNTGETSDYSHSQWNGGGAGPWGGTGNTSTPPSWAQGTFVWMNGPDRTFTIDNNGRVTLFTSGMTSYGTYYNGTMTIDGNVSVVTRTDRGLRTYNRSTGETSEYRRQ